MIKTWQERCEEHPDHEGIVTEQMIRDRMQEEIDELRQALAQPEQEPVRMRMPKVGDRIICLEDETLGTVKYLTAGGSPEIKFDDGSYGTYLLREFAELFSYAAPIHASDISQERVDETAKREHACPDWDFLEIDEDCPEFEACLCFDKAVKVEHEPEHSIEVRCFGPHISFITREPMSQYKDGDCFYRIKKEKNT